jgi:hypothetical protein
MTDKPNQTEHDLGDNNASDYVFSGNQTIEEVEKPQISTQSREKTRSRLAYILVTTFASIIAATLLFLGYFIVTCGVDKEFVTNTLTIIISPTVALVGAVTGFYYGSETK